MRNLLAVMMASLLIGGLVTVTPSPVVAHPNEGPPCDFLTGGGFIITRGWMPNPVTDGFTPLHDPAKANFGVGGGCKHGEPTWGHLNYIDHGNGLHVHWISITAYVFVPVGTGTDPKTHQPLGTRIICGTARTNHFGDVDFAVRAQDTGEPGVDDVFIIRLKKNGVIVYTTEGPEDHTLGGTGSGGGNIQLHKDNPSTTGSFGGTCAAAPEFV